MKFNKDLILQLREAKDKQQVEDLFKENGITKIGDKKNYLDWAMYAPSTFFSSFSETISKEAIYELTLEVFAAKNWKLHELYAQLNLINEEVAYSEAEKTLFQKLLDCTSQTEVDNVFINERITDLRERVNILRKVMKVNMVYDTKGNEVDWDDYSFDCAVFLEGSWKNC